MKRQLSVFVILCCSLALVAAACSSDSDGTTAETTTTAKAEPAEPSGSASDVRGVTDTEITVGGVAQLQSYAGLDEGVKARFERENAAGGVEGRTLNFIGTTDDGGDATADLQAVTALALQDEVFAVLPVVTQVFLPQSSDFLSENQVPYLGWGFMPGFCGSDWGYGFNGCITNPKVGATTTMSQAIEATGKPAKEVRIAVQQQDGAVAEDAVAGNVKMAEELGFELVYNKHNIPVGQGTVDYAPFVQEILSLDPDIVVTALDFPTELALTAALQGSGFEGMTVGYTTYLPGLLASQPAIADAIQGHYVSTPVPPQEENSEATKQMEADMEAIGEDPTLTLGMSIGYWTADLFIAMLKATGRDLTPETFAATVNNGFSYAPEAAGSVGPLEFPKNSTLPSGCSALVQVKGDKYDVTAPFDCGEIITFG